MSSDIILKKGNVYSFLNNVHRFITPTSSRDILYDENNKVKAYDNSINNYTNSTIPRGLSCFLIIDNDNTEHGLPYPSLNHNKYPCSYLLQLPEGFKMVYTGRLNLYRENINNTVRIIKNKAYHFHIYTTISGLSLKEFEDKIQNNVNWTICNMKAGSENNNEVPWTLDDEDGINDTIVRYLYQLSQHYYDISDEYTKLYLNEIMTLIANNKPTFKELCNDLTQTEEWYNLLLNSPVPESSTMGLIHSNVLDKLEEILGIQETNDESEEEYIISNKKSKTIHCV